MYYLVFFLSFCEGFFIKIFLVYSSYFITKNMTNKLWFQIMLLILLTMMDFSFHMEFFHCMMFLQRISFSFVFHHMVSKGRNSQYLSKPVISAMFLPEWFQYCISTHCFVLQQLLWYPSFHPLPPKWPLHFGFHTYYRLAPFLQWQWSGHAHTCQKSPPFLELPSPT